MLINFFKVESFHKFVGHLFKFFNEGKLAHFKAILYYNKMNYTYESYVAQMNRVYFTIYHWPTPYNYKIWFDQLHQQHKLLTIDPDNYTQIYSYTMQVASIKTINNKEKQTRGQKKKRKKRELQQELERETKAIGNWVKLQRKDLIQNLDKIKKKEEKARLKRQNKFGHLIQIHRQVFKHHSKKQSASHPINRRVNSQKTKKRVSEIKKTNLIFEKLKLKEIGKESKDDQWQSEEEQSQQEIKDKQIIKKQQKKQLKYTKIEYRKVGKLTGKIHNNIVLREWMSNCPSQALDDIVLKLVNRLAYKQAIKKVQRPDKAKKLIVSGIKQCKRTLTTIIDKKKSRMMIVALNIQRNPYKGGVDDQVQSTIQLAQDLNIPIIYASTRSNLARAFTGKWGPRITMISIVNFEGYQDMVQQMLGQWQKACQQYENLS